jgi:Ser/Thr protein kinase RdoA (MazF antagonist)
MDIFPAQYSTLSPVALKNFISDTYTVQPVACRLLSRNVSDTYLIDGRATKYIFRIYRTSYRALNEINGEIELLDILKDNGIPVSYPLADASGNKVQAFQAIEGVRYGVLFSYAEGKPAPIPDDLQLEIIGTEMARMHNVTAMWKLINERPVYDIQSTLLEPMELILHRFTDLPEEYERLSRIAETTVQKLSNLDTTLFSYGYCHYDLLPKNFHFDGQNNITFFDFDWCGKGFLVNDLMTFKVQLFFLVHLKAISAETAGEMFGQVITAYRKYRDLSEAELAAIPMLGVAFFIFGFGFYETNFDDFAINFMTSRFIKDRVALIEAWANS